MHFVYLKCFYIRVVVITNSDGKTKGDFIMGIAASQGRSMMLTARKSDIEFKVQVINQRRTTLAEQSSKLAQAFANNEYQNDDPMNLNTVKNADGTTTQLGASMLPGFTSLAATTGVAGIPQSSIATGDYEVQMTYVQSLDKELELREKDLQTQNKMIETELDAVQKVIDKSIEKGFKTLG